MSDRVRQLEIQNPDHRGVIRFLQPSLPDWVERWTYATVDEAQADGWEFVALTPVLGMHGFPTVVMRRAGRYGEGEP